MAIVTSGLSVNDVASYPGPEGQDSCLAKIEGDRSDFKYAFNFALKLPVLTILTVVMRGYSLALRQKISRQRQLQRLRTFSWILHLFRIETWPS
jgi:hypothetical protein